MSDPSSYWLTVMNIALGAVVLVCVIVIGIGVMQELADRRKKKAEGAKLDREVAELVASFRDSHAFDLPGLGPTMADGGESLKKKEER